MHKILFAFATMALMASCAKSYNVQGSSSISSLDGSKLYLKAVKNNELKSIDSCDSFISVASLILSGWQTSLWTTKASCLSCLRREKSL